MRIHCPTCGADQVPADNCRRCRCDLRLFQAALEKRKHLKNLVLCHLRDAQYAAAVEAALRYRAALPGEDSTRLLAVANLLAGRYNAALAACDSLPQCRDK